VAAPIVARVNDNVVRLGTAIVNWYLVADDDGVTVVDAAFPSYREQLGAGLRELGRKLTDVSAVVLTHAHTDHVGFAEQLRSELDIPVYVHRDDVELATTGTAFGSRDRAMLPYLRYPMTYRLMTEAARTGAMKPRPIGDVRTFADGNELPVPGRITAIHTPGHTPGHCVFVAYGTLMAGDAICTLNPLTGKRGPQLLPGPLNGDSDEAFAALDRLVGTGADVLLPGHGDPVREPNAAVEQAKARGKNT
jgi:glyoxylase-like metal-dependent hydrolase (beta-lactamase superfamily II)